ncbi:YggS family pyridoxal phosphate-dependent enzyme [Cytobacillus oceanisediminis]
MSRHDELAANLAEVRERVHAACAAAGRAPEEVTTIVVTKTYPASDVALLAELGVTDVGENRHPEAGDKRAELDDLLADGVTAPRLHFVGGLQTNKAGAVARYADVVQSVDRAKLARSLSRGAEAAERDLEVLLQVDFDLADPGRSGTAPADVATLADLVAELPRLSLRGLMTVAPLGVPPRPVFEQLRELGDTVCATHPGADVVSAGMSGDFEDAVAAGATHLRIGRAVLGERATLR